jgi:hypothetical protein
MSGATCGACGFRRESRISLRSSGLRLLWQQHCLEVAPRPAMLAWSMRRVGLIDIMVGNAACLGTSLGASQRSTTRRCASQHIATHARAAGDIPAPLARLARASPNQSD